MSDDPIHEGGCLCGAIRYRITGPIAWAAHCHCSMCRRASGAAALTWATVLAANFTFTRGKPATYRSSENAERRFCSSCGSPLTFWSAAHRGEMDVSLGTMDHPEDNPAGWHTWAKSRLSWLSLDDHLVAYAESTPADQRPAIGAGTARRRY
jgi:hypothetical protein